MKDRLGSPEAMRGFVVSQFRNGVLAALLASATALAPLAAAAETISGALAKAYHLNSTMNSARAGTRATDENVPIAKSGYRPTIIGSGAVDYSVTRNRLNVIGNSTTNLFTGSFGVQINQTLFNGFQTRNNVRAAKAQVNASDESLRNTEQNTLFNAASAYMDVIRDRQIAVLDERNLEFLSEQVRAARSRFEVGEGTRTDVAQAEASQSSAVATLAEARAQVQTSEATYQEIVGEAPHSLAPAAPLTKLLPKSIASAQVDRLGPASCDPGQPASGRRGRLHRKVERGRHTAAAVGQCRCVAELDQF